MLKYATQFNYCRELFSAMVESWNKLKASNVFSSFIVCYNRDKSLDEESSGLARMSSLTLDFPPKVLIRFLEIESDI